jgi:hypothetical protein
MVTAMASPPLAWMSNHAARVLSAATACPEASVQADDGMIADIP